MNINLTPSPSDIAKFGPLAYISEAERKRLMEIPYGQFKPAIKALTAQIKAAIKRQAAIEAAKRGQP